MIPTITREAALELLTPFRGKHVLVVGDVMLDEYVRGEVSRISPEAPVPVVDLTERSLRPGGAANAAANVVSLGGRATLVGVVGSDGPGASLRGAVHDRGIDAESLVFTGERPTTHKLRVVARSQQIVRVDVESREALSPKVEAEVVATARHVAASVDAVVISDYAKGVVTGKVAAEVIAAARARGIPVVVDPKGRNYAKYAGATVITPNQHELDDATGVATHNLDASIVEAASKLLPALGGASVLVTRGALGMTLVGREAEPLHMPTVARSVFDVTGAGDTVVGTLTLALAAGVPIADALLLATHAASIAVGRPGTIAVTRDELLESFPG